MSSTKMFRFTAENMTTGETAAFIGQGADVKTAFADALKNATDSFRPSTSGAKRPEHGIGVTLADGKTRVSRTLKDFEGDTPFCASPDGREAKGELVEVDL